MKHFVDKANNYMKQLVGKGDNCMRQSLDIVTNVVVTYGELGN